MQRLQIFRQIENRNTEIAYKKEGESKIAKLVSEDILKRYFIGNFSTDTIKFHKIKFIFLDPHHKSYDNFRRLIETSLAFLLIKDNRNNSKNDRGLLIDINMKINYILKGLVTSLTQWNKMNDKLFGKLFDLLSLYYLVVTSIQEFKDLKDESILFENIKERIDKKLTNLKRYYNYNLEDYDSNSKYREYSGVLTDIATDFDIKKGDEDTCFMIAKILMKSQIVCLMIGLVNTQENILESCKNMSHIFEIDDVIGHIYDDHSLFKNKAPETEKLNYFLKTRGIIKIIKQNHRENLFSNEYFQEFHSRRRSTASRKAGPEYKSSEWSLLTKKENQVYVSGISGLGLISQGVLEMINIPIKERYQFFKLASPILVFYFTGHSFFEFHQGSELFNKEYEKKPSCYGFNSWEKYINSISGSLFNHAFNLAYSNHKRISIYSYNDKPSHNTKEYAKYKLENSRYFLVKRRIYRCINSNILDKLVSNRAGRKSQAIRTYKKFISFLIDKRYYISEKQLAVGLICIIRIIPLTTGRRLNIANTLYKFIQSIDKLYSRLLETVDGDDKLLKSHGLGFLKEFTQFNPIDNSNINGLLSKIYDNDFILSTNKQVNENMQSNSRFGFCCSTNNYFSRGNNDDKFCFIYSEEHKRILYEKFYNYIKNLRSTFAKIDS